MIRFLCFCVLLFAQTAIGQTMLQKLPEGSSTDDVVECKVTLTKYSYNEGQLTLRSRASFKYWLLFHNGAMQSYEETHDDPIIYQGGEWVVYEESLSEKQWYISYTMKVRSDQHIRYNSITGDSVLRASHVDGRTVTGVGKCEQL